jgi:hypothetical protein
MSRYSYNLSTCGNILLLLIRGLATTRNDTSTGNNPCNRSATCSFCVYSEAHCVQLRQHRILLLLWRRTVAHSVTYLHIHVVDLRRYLLGLLLGMNTVTWLLFAHILSSKVWMISHQMLAWSIIWMVMMMTCWASCNYLSTTTWVMMVFLRSFMRFLLLLGSCWRALDHMIARWNITCLFLSLLLKLFALCICYCIVIARWQIIILCHDCCS